MHQAGLNFFSGGGLIDGDKELLGCGSCLMFMSWTISCFISFFTSVLMGSEAETKI